MPPPPSSVPTVHPLLAQHADSLLGSGHGHSSNIASLQLSNATSRLRHQHQQLRSRISRFIIPSLNLQLTTTTPAGLPTSAIVSAALGGGGGGQPQQQQSQQQIGPGIQTITTTTTRQSNLPYHALNEILQGTELPMPGASYDMFVSGIYNPQMNSTQDALTYNEAGEHSTNLYIIRNPLARWNEECTVLDSHSMHYAISLVKPKIVEALEKYKNEELVEKRDKKVKEDEKVKRMKDLSDAAAAAEFKSAPPAASSSSTTLSHITATEIAAQIAAQLSEPVGAAASITIEEPPLTIRPLSLEDVVAEATTQVIEEQIPPSVETIQVAVEIMPEVSTPKQETPQTTTETPPTADSTQQATTTIEEIAVSQEAATQFLLNFLSGACNIFTIINADEKRIAVEALRISDNQRAAQELASINVENYPQNFVFLDSKYPTCPTDDY